MAINWKEQVIQHINEHAASAINASVSCAKKFGVNIYLIGGIVRDIMLQKKIKDIDICIEGDAITFCEFMENEIGCKIISKQENLRTAKIKFQNKTEIDFASTRQEKYEGNGQLPIAYNFGCKLSEDVQRRDFTINTMAIKLSEDNEWEFYDYYLGQFDITGKRIRILHPKSFEDDPSRIIRALKFKERNNFSYEAQTYHLMQEYLKSNIPSIPLERIKNELKSYFAIQKKGLYDELIKTNAYKLLTPKPIKNILYDEYIDEIFMILLFADSDNIPERLNLTGQELKEIKDTKILLKNNISQNNYDIYKAFIDKEENAIKAYYAIIKDEKVIKFRNELQKTKIETTGKDLISLGYTPSNEFNKILDSILKAKLEGKIGTKSEEIEYVKKHFKT